MTSTSIYSLESHTKILVLFSSPTLRKTHLFMLEAIHLMSRGYLVYKMVIIKSLHGDYFKSYLLPKPGIFLFFHF